MYAAIIWFDDSITIIKNENEAELLRSVVEMVVMVGADGWYHGIVKDQERFDDKLSDISGTEEIDDYETVADELIEFLDPIGEMHSSKVLNHTR